MIRLLQWLFFGHVHKWNILKEAPLFEGEEAKMPHGYVYVLQCERCGDVKRESLR